MEGVMKIEVQNLTKYYGKKLALNKLTAVFEPGIYALLGPNGSGKSTFMNILVDNLKRTEGTILCDGTEILSLGKHYRKRIGFLPQKAGFYPNFTGRDFLYYICALKGIKKDKEKMVSQLSEKVNLNDVIDNKISTYSGGMKQRLGIAQAFIGEPELIVLDEPTVGLDPKERMHFKNMLMDAGKNSIVILSTHIVSDVDEIGKTVLLLKNGQLIKNDLQENITKELEGAVWKIEDKYLDYVNKNQIIKTITEKEKTYCIVYDKKQPIKEAVSQTPSLDDVYFYYFGEGNQ
jgi:ABC-2 type transport system ATP-binding protein